MNMTNFSEFLTNSVDNTPHYINGQWHKGSGDLVVKYAPFDNQIIYQSHSAGINEINLAVISAREAQKDWFAKGFEFRAELIKRYEALLMDYKEAMANIIANETGKPFWEALTEVQTMIAKVDISIKSYHERTPNKSQPVADGYTALQHKPHGVLAVFGPYNFPGHLPNGHIVPALLAGNTILFKPSELTPITAKCMLILLEKAGIPAGVVNLVQGDKSTGIAIVDHKDINGILFTGSAKTGIAIHKQLAGQVNKMLALEMGGNNPLIVDSYADIDAAVYATIQSAFISSGQRCTCARRLLVKNGESGDRFIAKLVETASKIKQGHFNDNPAPFMGTVISQTAANQLLQVQTNLINQGAKVLLEMRPKTESSCLLTPGILDATGLELPDEEYFGPLLTIYRYDLFDEAINLANNTQYGLAAGLFSTEQASFEEFKLKINAGVVNWNKPITGASSGAPFGGIGLSGNHRPSAFYAADYCAWPMASMASDELALPVAISPGLPF